MLAYVDTSALAKLVVSEGESVALLGTLRDMELVASALVITELRRAVARYPESGVAERVDEVLDAVTLVNIDRTVLEAAGRMSPASLRSLDSLHIATALRLGDRLDLLVTYDQRMREAAENHALIVSTPT